MKKKNFKNLNVLPVVRFKNAGKRNIYSPGDTDPTTITTITVTHL